jgi:hypothetical protein
MGLFGRGRDEGVTEPQARGVGFGSAFSRMVATGGIIGIGTGAAAIMGSQEVAHWIVGIVVAGLSVLLAAIVWSSRPS